MPLPFPGLPPSTWPLSLTHWRQECGTWPSSRSAQRRYPLALVAGRNLPDGGLLLARPLGILLTGWLAWLLASIPVVPFGRGSVVLAAGLVAGSGLALVRQRAIWLELRARWRLVLASEGMFALAFSLLAILRALNPDLWHPVAGGEKPMDLAILTAVSRATVFPPNDPWFAGGVLNYYYFGQLLVAALLRLSGIPPEVGANLALATWFALTVTTGFGLGFNLAAAAGRRSAALAGLATVFLLVGVGNLDLLRQVLPPLLEGRPPAFDYFASSRVMADQNTITEFPAFTWLFGDLHAHLLALPLVLSALMLSLALLLGGGWTTALLLGLTTGVLRATNSWDFPTVLLLAAAACLMPLASQRDRSARWHAIGKLGTMVGAAWLAGWPFDAHFESFYRFVTFAPATTPLADSLTMFGLFFWLLGSWAFGEWLAARGSGRGWRLALPTGALLVVAAASGQGTAGLALVLAVVVIWVTARRLAGRQATLSEGASASLAALGLGVIALVEFFTLAGDPERTNTVFKFWFQAWVLLAVASAQLLLALPGMLRQWPQPGRASWLAGTAALSLAALLWPAAALPQRLSERLVSLPPTLDGLAFLASASYGDEQGVIFLADDLAALRWLREHGVGPLLEGRTPPGGWGARFATASGIPTVLGWEFHQLQQRRGYAAMVLARVQAVDQFYASGDPAVARAVLRAFRPRLVVLGALEEHAYPPAGIAAVRSLVGQVLQPVYQSGRTTLYTVLDP
ncbi:MAG: hypothetical protein KatS3mg061_2560 [Dehalococcoidia bacterium]|nr:MAG: hypothetical protein KatS3mg061_2560 [Dehalococcoidia bacterium]